MLKSQAPKIASDQVISEGNDKIVAPLGLSCMLKKDKMVKCYFIYNKMLRLAFTD